MTALLISVAICATGIFTIGFVIGCLAMWGYECDLKGGHE